MDDVWCSLDMAADIAGLHSALADPFWPADLDLMVSTDEVEGMADMDASGIYVGGGDDRFMLPSSTTSSLSSKRSLSQDSGGSSGSGSFTLDLADASRYQAPAPPAPHNPLAGAADHDDEAIMRAMMAVMSSSSASPSSSASSHPQPFCRDRDSSMQQQPTAMAPQLRGGGPSGHVMVKSSLSMSPERSSSGGRGQQQEDPTRAASNNTGQLYHMMSERKRREKLNDSFHALRSLLPPCSKKDKTTVLTKAAGYLKTLEAQVSDLEEKNSKLEKHIPSSDSEEDVPHQQRRQRAKVQITKAASSDEVVNLTVMVMVECDVVELVLRILECLRWMEQVSVMSVDADTYSPQVLLKAIASIKLRIMVRARAWISFVSRFVF
ncbi:putative transcription factor bHLH041 isoform X2 [Hordeum vulgare subsp. vulgare]|uniref:Predicted protein n=1 Tax=Hordeum vulgare subsp. vulgare TaxID=112509 RepID=F2DXR6_HORVV|nr:putative transcription factor bHLH041 isoform X2 [Hordeum vulgare subsp. vulgare]BAJ99887.1 predicted protein [Hordeum vulgare subsp. vulgare]